MATNTILPKLITFDGEARSGKGTIVQATKDYIRDELGRTVMLIDAGQVFRSLVVMASRSGVNPDDSSAIDAFLSDEESAERCVLFVKEVYAMKKNERDGLLYTNEVSKNSAKFGARPLCQAFKDNLLKKWLRDAAIEGFEIVLLDGRALEEVGSMLEREGLCEFIISFFFVCDPVVGARRTLGYYPTPYNELSEQQRAEIDKLVAEINVRNESDRNRQVHPVLPPSDAVRIQLPQLPASPSFSGRATFIVDTSANMTKNEMSEPIQHLTKTTIA